MDAVAIIRIALLLITRYGPNAIDAFEVWLGDKKGAPSKEEWDAFESRLLTKTPDSY